MKNKQRDDQDELKQVATTIIIEHLRDQKHNANKVDFALRSLSAVARLKATDRAGDATQYAVIRDISKTAEDIERYLAVSLPHLNPKPLLSSSGKD